MLRRIVVGLLIAALSATTAQAATGLHHYPKRLPEPPEELRTENFSYGVWRLAQVDAQVSTKYTIAKGMLDGEMMGENVSTGGKFAFGFVIGALTGVIGSGIGYFIVSPAP